VLRDSALFLGNTQKLPALKVPSQYPPVLVKVAWTKDKSSGNEEDKASENGLF
jgi:hypothetical protein